jgi:hypothetical protein
MEILYDLALDWLIQSGKIALRPFFKLNRPGPYLSTLVQESAFFLHFSGVLYSAKSPNGPLCRESLPYPFEGNEPPGM